MTAHSLSKSFEYACSLVQKPFESLSPSSPRPPQKLPRMAGSRSHFARQSLHISIDPSPYDSHSISLSPNSTSASPSSPHASDATSSTTPISGGVDWIICSVLCLYDFDSTDPDHLPFSRNDILDVVKQEESGWWAALRQGELRVGWIPKAYVQPLSEDMAERLQQVQVNLRVFEYEAERLYESTPTASLALLYDEGLPSPSPTRDQLWVPMNNASASSLQLVTPTDLLPPMRDYVSGSRRETRTDPLRPPPSPMTPVPQVPSTQSAPLQVNKPTPPTPLDSDYPVVDVRRHRSVSDLDRASDRIRRRRSQIAPNRNSPLGNVAESKASSEDGGQELDTPEPDKCFDRDSKLRAAKIKKIMGSEDALAFHNAIQHLANLPWYLQPTYTAEQLKVERDGSVSAGTLNALIERLTADPLNMALENVFKNAFFMTFRTFATAEEVFDLLVERFRMPHPEDLSDEEFQQWKEKRLGPTRKRVLTAFTIWLENHGLLEEEPHIAQRLTEFLTLISSPPSIALTAKLIIKSLERLTFAPSGKASPSASTRKRRKSRAHKNDLLRLDSTEVAEELCLLEHKKYAKVRPQECLSWCKTQTGPAVANLLEFCSTHDKLATWVKTSILENEVLGRRALTVDFWIKVAEKCRALNNFASMSAVINALSCTAVSRLHLTWAHVKGRSHLDSLVRYNDPSGGFAIYRGLLSNVEGACVPYIGMFLTDLVHIGDQFSDIVPSPNGKAGEPLICFSKRQRWFEVITVMLRYQSRPYNLPESDSLRLFVELNLRAASTKDQGWFWTKSQEVQQSELAHADIRRGLEAAGF